MVDCFLIARQQWRSVDAPLMFGDNALAATGTGKARDTPIICHCRWDFRAFKKWMKSA